MSGIAEREGLIQSITVSLMSERPLGTLGQVGACRKGRRGLESRGLLLFAFICFFFPPVFFQTIVG